MKSVQEAIVTEMAKMVSDQEGAQLTGGRQLSTGNQYPNEKQINLLEHVKGTATYALDVAYTNDAGIEVCKWGIIDIDENGKEGLDKARQIKEYLETHGFCTAMAFSGGKGYHVYVVCEPVPVEIMKKALKNVKIAFSFKGESIPGDAFRCKPAPCLHQVAENMSYLFRDEPYPENFGLNNLPDGFYEVQLEILSEITPTPANIVVKFAVGDGDFSQSAENEDIIPDLSRLEEDFTPCIKALIDNGGDPTIGTYDKNNLTLAGYCHSKGLPVEAKVQYAKEMAQNAENGPVETTKSFDDKIRHFRSILDTPSVKEQKFRCIYVLSARKNLKFNCSVCKARPEGVKTQSGEEESGFILEEPLAEDFLVYIIQNGRPAESINPAIMPRIGYTWKSFNKKTFQCEMYSAVLSGINSGVNNATALSNWVDTNITIENLTEYFDGAFKTDWNDVGGNRKSAVFKEFKNKLIRCYKNMQQENPVKQDEWEKLLERAVNLSMRHEIHERTKCLSSDSKDRSKEIFTSVSDFTHESTQILATSQRGAVVPLKDKAVSLLEFITGDGSAKAPTPFRVLNDLLGGGFRNGGLYVIVSSPGGGKTTICAQIADHAAMNGIPVILVSMEMAQEELFVNSIARFGEINSAKIMSPYKDIKENVLDQVGEAAEKYLEQAEDYLYVIEGDHATSPARIESISSMVRAQHNMTKEDPLLVVVDYLQLLSTGVEALDYNSNETPKISELAVKTKQLARDNNLAVLAISDVTKDEQGKVISNKEYTMNSTRGSNRIAHAADVVMGLYSESSASEGGKAKTGPWEMYVEKVKHSENANEFLENLQQATEDIETGGDGATVFSRLELIKNRAGQGRGSQFMLYHRSYHKFEAVDLEGQEKAEGRG